MRASAISSTDVLFADSVHWEKRRCFLVTFCHRTKSYPLLGAEALALKHRHQKHSHWIPAFAGMPSGESERHPHPNPLPPAERGKIKSGIPAFAGKEELKHHRLWQGNQTPLTTIGPIHGKTDSPSSDDTETPSITSTTLCVSEGYPYFASKLSASDRECAV